MNSSTKIKKGEGHCWLSLFCVSWTRLTFPDSTENKFFCHFDAAEIERNALVLSVVRKLSQGMNFFQTDRKFLSGMGPKYVKSL